MKRTAWGLSAMVFSLVCGTMISLGSFIAMGGQLDSDVLGSSPLSIPTLLVSCLDPLAIVLEIAAILLIQRNRSQFGALHQRLASAALILYIIWAAANLLGFLPLSLISARSGSITVALAGQWIKAFSALLAISVPVLLIYGLGSRSQRTVLVIGLLLSAIGSFGTIAMSLKNFQLQPTMVAERTLYVAKLSVDYTTGAYPVLLALSHLGGFVYLFVYGYLAWQTLQNARAEPVR